MIQREAEGPALETLDSGISIVVRSCTFFRNYATLCGGFGVFNAWPLALSVEETQLVQNQAWWAQHDYVGTYPRPRSPIDGRSGFSSVAYTNSHFDGGFSTEGLDALAVSMIYSPDMDIDTVMNVTYDQVSYVDHRPWLWAPAVFVIVWPPPSDRSGQLNLYLADFTMRENTCSTTGDSLDSAYVSPGGTTHFLMERSRFEGNGNLDSS